MQTTDFLSVFSVPSVFSVLKAFEFLRDTHTEGIYERA